MALELTDIKNIDDLPSFPDLSALDVLLGTDVSAETDNKLTIQELAEKLNVLGGGVYLASGRKFAEPKIVLSGFALTGWVKVGYFPNGYVFESGHCEISIVIRQSTFKASFDFHDRSTNTGLGFGKCELLKVSSSNKSDGYINGARIAYNDTLGGKGAWLEVNVADVGDGKLSIQMSDNNAEVDSPGFSLVTPEAASSTLPDGTTAVNAYLEAGAEYLYYNSSATGTVNTITAYKEASNDELRVSVTWPELPKQDADTLTIPSGSFRFWDPFTDVLSPTPVTYTITDVVILGRKVSFTINETDISLGMSTFAPFNGIFNGTDQKLVLS